MRTLDAGAEKPVSWLDLPILGKPARQSPGNQPSELAVRRCVEGSFGHLNHHTARKVREDRPMDIFATGVTYEEMARSIDHHSLLRPELTRSENSRASNAHNACLGTDSVFWRALRAFQYLVCGAHGAF